MNSAPRPKKARTRDHATYENSRFNHEHVLQFVYQNPDCIIRNILGFVKTRLTCKPDIDSTLDPLLAARVDLHAAGLALHRLATLVPLTAHLAEHDVAAVPRLLESAFVFSVQVGSSELYHGILCIFNAV